MPAGCPKVGVGLACFEGLSGEHFAALRAADCVGGLVRETTFVFVDFGIVRFLSEKILNYCRKVIIVNRLKGEKKGEGK